MTVPSACLGDDTIADLLAGTLPPAERSGVEQHLADCAECAALLAFVRRARDGGPPTNPTLLPVLAPGALVGRFIVLGAAGEGAMGAVHIAHDPTLDRKVALKVLRGAQAHSTQARSRLEREAQALARLSSPHLVGVFDVLEWHGQLVVAMEYVEGSTLRQWLREQPRSWKEVVEVFLQAARGLADVHAAGLVHRDFKPDNVLLARTPGAPRSAAGVVKVADLGLVSSGAERDTAEPTGPTTSDELLTSPGALLGTPAYMAPEQCRGEPATPLSDQFSFCVALYEGLEGVRPFDGYSLRQLVALRGLRPVRPWARRVPAWLRRLVLRGLEREPSARYPSMAALIADLVRHAHARRLRRSLTVVAGLALAALVALPLARRPPNPCVEERLAVEWSPAAREAVRRGGLRGEALRATEQALDDFVEQWDADLGRECRAPQDDSRPTPSAMAYYACLNTRRREFRETIASLARGDDELLRLGPGIVSLLPRAGACVAAWGEAPAPAHDTTPQPRLHLLQARQRLAEGDVAGARAQVVATLAACQPCAGVIEAEALLLRARLEAAAGRRGPAEDAARRAGLVSLPPPRHAQGLVESWLVLALLAASDPGRPPAERAREVSWLASLASAELGPVPRGGGPLEALGDAVEAELALLRGDATAAIAAAERSLELQLRAEPRDGLAITDARLRLARAQLAGGQAAEARAPLEALAVAEPLPAFLRGAALEQLARTLEALGEGEAATRRLEEARRWLHEADVER